MLKRLVFASSGFLIAFVMVAGLSLISGPILTKARLIEAIKEGFSSGSLWKLERWTECAALTMQFVRHEGTILNALDTRWVRPQRHTCDELQALIAGPPYAMSLNAPSPYVNYPFGALHLQSVALSVFSMSTIMEIYGVLSYASIVALLLGAWRNSHRQALLIVAPTALCLCFAFEQHRYADNTPWAPGFFVGFFALAIFLAMRNFFRDRAHRLGFFFFIATMVSYFDHMQGALPVILSLTIVLNHFFYAQRDEDTRRLAALRNAIIVALCFSASFVLLTIIRLELLQSVQSLPVWSAYFQGLASRVSSAAGDITSISTADLILKLWSERKELTGSRTTSTILLCAGLSAWLFSLASIVTFRVKRTAADVMAGRDTAIGILVLAMGSGVIFAWYWLLPNHTWIHAWLMVRMLALPVAYGLVALLLSIMLWREAESLQSQAH